MPDSAHVLGRRREYSQIERLGGLDRLPRPGGFTVACFPVRLEGCGAAWARAVAIFDIPSGEQPRRSGGGGSKWDGAGAPARADGGDT